MEEIWALQSPDDTATQRSSTRKLNALITRYRRGRSYPEISRDCGGYPKSASIQKMATLPIRNFPDPDTLHGLARGLALPASEIIAACATDLGFNMSAYTEESALVLYGARDLPQSAQDVLITMAKELQNAYSQA